MEPETAPTPDALPKISDQTRQKLLEELALDIDPKTQQISGSISGERSQSRYDALTSLAENVFGDILSTNSAFVETINQNIRAKKEHSTPSLKDDVVKGMAVVFRIYHLESNFSLLENLHNLTPEDLDEVARAIEDSLSSAESQADILSRLLTTKRIPEMELNLNLIVNKAAEVTLGDRKNVREGAAAMYYALLALKSKLFRTPDIGTNLNPPNA